MGFTPTFKITQTDGQVIEIKTGAVDLVRWEKKNGRSFIDDNPTIEQLLWIAWAAGIRQKIISDGYAQKFEGWLEIVDDLDRLDTDDDQDKESDPTEEDSPPADWAS